MFVLFPEGPPRHEEETSSAAITHQRRYPIAYWPTSGMLTLVLILMSATTGRAVLATRLMARVSANSRAGLRRGRAPSMTTTESLAVGRAVREQFPVLAQHVNGHPLVYLDSAATSHKPRYVLDAVRQFYDTDNSNVHRGAHTLSVRATEAYEGARDKVASFINAADRREVVFTKGATEAINLVASTWGRNSVRRGDEIVLTEMEHHANIVPWQLLAEEVGAKIVYGRVDDATGGLDEEHMLSLINEKTKLVAFAHVSNVLACANPVKRIARAASEVGAMTLLDACQSVPHMPVDVQALGVDFVVASGHKMCAPTGIGFLWGRHRVLEGMPPYQGGGEMIDEVSLEKTTFAPPPGRFEAGTPAIAQAVGLGAAVDFLSELGMDAVQAYERELGIYLYEQLLDVEGVKVLGPTSGRAALAAFTVEGIHASDLSAFLDQDGVAIRSGHHCTQPLHTRLGIDASARASLYLYSTREDVDAFVQAVRSTQNMFKEIGA